MKKLLFGLLIGLFVMPVCAEETSKGLNREETTVFKKKLTGVLEAMGAPPEGFSKEKENFQLPTEAYKGDDGKFQSLGAYANVKFAIKQVKQTEKDHEDMGAEYQKKILAAQAAGDYEAISTLSQEMSQKSSSSQLKAIEAQEKLKEPIQVEIKLNENLGMAIDPDMVLFEKPGVIALKEKRGEEATGERIYICFDPVKLKDTKKISVAQMTASGTSVTSKTAVKSALITLDGSIAEVEAWAKRVNTAKVLALLDK